MPPVIPEWAEVEGMSRRKFLLPVDSFCNWKCQWQLRVKAAHGTSVSDRALGLGPGGEGTTHGFTESAASTFVLTFRFVRRGGVDHAHR